MSGTSDKASGKANQLIGKVTGNKKVEAKGNAQESKGHIKDKLKDVGDKLSQKVDEASKKADK